MPPCATPIPGYACRLQPGQTHDVTLGIPGAGHAYRARAPAQPHDEPTAAAGPRRARRLRQRRLHGALHRLLATGRRGGLRRRLPERGAALLDARARERPGRRRVHRPAAGQAPLGRLLRRQPGLGRRRVERRRLAARLACDLSGRLAAVAMVAGGYSQIRDCHPDHPVSILEMHARPTPWCLIAEARGTFPTGLTAGSPMTAATVARRAATRSRG